MQEQNRQAVRFHLDSAPKVPRSRHSSDVTSCVKLPCPLVLRHLCRGMVPLKEIGAHSESPFTVRVGLYGA
jgi:hypothetical protein